MEFCPSCGEQLSKGSDFCSSCGEQITSDEGEKNVVVNVQQSADHTNSTAASSGDSTANADATTQNSGEGVKASAEAQTSNPDDYTKGEYLQVVFSLGLGIGLIGAFISYITGYSEGLGWVDFLTVLPYAIPFWLLGLLGLGFVGVLVTGFIKAE